MSIKSAGLPCLVFIVALFSGAAAASQHVNHEPRRPVLQLAQTNAGQQPNAGQPVGQAPPKEEQPRPQVQGIPQLGGVLTPRGVLIVTPSIQASTSQVNRFNFNGVSIVGGALLIGLVEAENTDRDLVEAALSFRLGLSNRFEVGLKVPYIYRRENATLTFVSLPGQPQQEERFENAGLGDVEAYLHYQINRGLKGWPFFVANLRYKSTTGMGPFEVSRNAKGLPTELATGSGFHGIEPSLTILLPSDPAVFFANFGYLFNLPDDVDETLGVGDDARRIGEVDPGDAFRMSFGMAYAMNQYASFNLGYKNDYIFPTSTQIDGLTFKSERLIVGAAMLGFNYALSARSQVNVSLQIGVTADAPDVVLSLQIPFAFAL